MVIGDEFQDTNRFPIPDHQKLAARPPEYLVVVAIDARSYLCFSAAEISKISSNFEKELS